MKKNFCDICGKELVGWEDCGDLRLAMTQSSSNPLTTIKFSNGNYQRAEIKVDEMCFDCARRVSKALFEALNPILTPVK